MAKTVKFNLICDGNPVRTVDDLRENFSLEDVLAYYNNKLLHRWLKVRGYDDYLKSVEAIDATDNIEILSQLISIFELESDESKILESLAIYFYKDLKQKLYKSYEEQDMKVESIVSDYFSGYYELLAAITEHPEDIGFVKATIQKMIDDYYDIISSDYRDVFYYFYENAPIAIFVMLTYDDFREWFLPLIEENEDGTKCCDIDKKSDSIYETTNINDKKQYMN